MSHTLKPVLFHLTYLPFKGPTQRTMSRVATDKSKRMKLTFIQNKNVFTFFRSDYWNPSVEKTFYIFVQGEMKTFCSLFYFIKAKAKCGKSQRDRKSGKRAKGCTGNEIRHWLLLLRVRVHWTFRRLGS